MAKLILIKHALPEIQAGVPSLLWELGRTGREQARALAERLRPLSPGRVVTSIEPKASETGRIVAEALGLPCAAGEGLQENDRTEFPFLPADEWRARFIAFFDRPGERLIGNESADEAHSRFSAAVARVVEAAESEENIAIVTHGTVLSLFVARANGIAPFPLWERLQCPSFVVLELPDYRLLSVTEDLRS